MLGFNTPYRLEGLHHPLNSTNTCYNNHVILDTVINYEYTGIVKNS